ncbi:hypothetical protein MY11210_007619 [Beauveria gryllotalpidicola]
MDPLSICASAVALIGAAKSVTKALYSFTHYATHAEAHVASLCSEITTLTEFLSSINKTLKSCRRKASALALVDAELWRQSDLALQDCEATLDELSTFVAKLTTSKKTPFWRAKVAVDMSIHARKLEQFRVRLKRSNYALQTVLQTITVSFSLQNNASQDLILLELDKLKVYIEEAVWMAKRSPVSTQPSLTTLSESMATKNLHGLVKAAENFYSSATTTVGSSLGGSIADWPLPASETASSVAELSPFRTERLHEYIQNTRQESNPFSATITEARGFHTTEFPEYPMTDESAELTRNASMPMKPAPDAKFQLPLLEVLEDFAIEKMKNRDFENAVTFLKQALSGEMGPVSEAEVQVRLQIRLGMCYVLQRKIPETRKVISKMERNDGLENREVLHLMHALAMVYFAQKAFTEAKDLCNRIVEAKTRLLGRSHPETLISLGFLRHLYDELDQPIHMEATRRLMPHDYVYKHSESEFDFLAEHAMLMPVMVLEPGPFELPCTPVSENSQSAQMAQTQSGPNHDLKRALTRYESQQTDTMKEFLSLAVVYPDEKEDCPAPEISAATNGQKRMISHSMTTMRRHFSAWQSPKLATVRKEQAVTGNPNIRRSKTVLHKAPPPGSQMESARPTGLTRAKSLLSMLKTETPIVTARTEEALPVFELDSKCITRKDFVKRLADTGQDQKTFADHSVQASLSDVPPSELARVSVRPLDMSLDMIPELPELDAGDGCDLKNRATIVIEDSNDSSDSSISRGSSVSDNRSTVSGSSYSTNTTVSEVAPASFVDCRDGDNSTVLLRSTSQRSELAQLAQNDSDSSFDRPQTFLPSDRKDASLPVNGSCGGTRPLGGLLAAHRFTHSMYKPYGRDRLPDALPKAMGIRHGLRKNGYRSQSPDQTAQALPDISRGGWRDGSGETHGLKRTFSWSRGDENLSIIRLKPN